MDISTLKLSVLAASVALVTTQVQAAAFQLAEQNATGLGRAYSGEGAIGDNAAVLGRNPAAMTLFDKPALSGGVIYVNPDIDVEGKGANVAAGKALGLPTDSKDIADDAWVPFVYYVHPINEQWVAGVGAFTNYGLSTTYQDDHYAGPVAGKTNLKTFNLNPNIAFKANEHISLGAGFNAVYADAELIRHSGVASAQVNGQTAGSPVATSLVPTNEFVRLKGDDWGYGWNIGTLIEADEHNRWALTYRSKIKLTLEGDYSSALPNLGGQQLAPDLPIGTGGQSIPGQLDLTLPAIAEVSGFHQIQPDWALHYGIMWTEWSSFEELRAQNGAGDTLFKKDEKFNNSWRVSMGATHTLNDQWVLRGGLAYDQSPVPADTRSISIPDVDRTWYTLGATYAATPNLSVDGGFAFLHGKKVDVIEDGFEFRSGGNAYLFGLQMNYDF